MTYVKFDNKLAPILDKYFIKNKELYFIEFDQLNKLPYDELPKEQYELFHILKHWIDSYLTQPHPELGRSGPMCPFVPASIAKRSFYLTAIYREKIDIDWFANKLAKWKSIFLNIHPKGTRNSIYRTIAIVFPHLSVPDADELFKKILKKCKTSFVEDGLMLGEFHNGPPEKYSLHNPHFKPLRSPVPVMVIREMMPTDIAFLKEEEAYTQAYIKKFGSSNIQPA